MVFHRSILDWRRGWGQSAMVLCALCYICNFYGVMVFQIYARLEEGVGSICHRYMCIVLYIYMKLLWCHGFPQNYAQMEEGVGSICHRYMCILLYISRSASRSSKFGVALFLASMFD